jgi:uncharacterized protein involved in propanediol utilization
MNGYPKHVATVNDYAHLLAVPEFRERALAELAAIRDADDAIALRVLSVSDEGVAETEEIENPMPRWKVKGFLSRETVAEMILHAGGEV